MKRGRQLRFLFDGSDYKHERDSARLSGQLLRIWDAMRNGQWRTLDEIASMTRTPHSSASAQLRNLRKEKFGSHTIEKRYTDDGLYLYRLIIKKRDSVHNEQRNLEGTREGIR